MKPFFRLLLKINNALLPRYAKKDPSSLGKWQQAIVAYRYWVLMKAL